MAPNKVYNDKEQMIQMWPHLYWFVEKITKSYIRKMKIPHSNNKRTSSPKGIYI